jgi:hypothetical protein
MGLARELARVNLPFDDDGLYEEIGPSTVARKEHNRRDSDNPGP